MAITTPRLIPTFFIAHCRAFWAFLCSLVSIVRVSESPGWASRDRLKDLGLPAGRVPLDALRAVDPSQLGLVLGLDADLADEVVGEVAVLLEIEELLAGDRSRVAEDLGHQRPVGVLTAGLDGDLDTGQVEAGLGDQPGRALVHVVAIRTRSNVEPGFPSIVALMSSAGMLEQRGESVDDGRPLLERQVRRDGA